jgi:two-component system cell cycle response regulator
MRAMNPGKTTGAIPVAFGSGHDNASLVLIYGGPELGKRFELRQDAVIGRDPSCDIVVDMSFVSRQHARLTRNGSEWLIEDLGSRNGTQVNGAPAEALTPLRNGDQIKAGGAIFKFLAGGNVEALFHEEIYRMTIFDALTKVHNKRYALDFLDREIARARRYASPLTLVILDLDHFKAVNDTHGHQAGDLVLEEAASRIAALIRREQLFARYGGEEFMLVLPELDREQVRDVCESVRNAIAAEPFDFDGTPLKVTISLGGAMLDDAMDRDALIGAADAQLYAAKRAGRNRVVLTE